MNAITPEQWQALYERTQSAARDLAKLIEDVESGYTPTPEELAAFEEASAALVAATKQVKALEAHLDKWLAMAAQAPNN